MLAQEMVLIICIVYHQQVYYVQCDVHMHSIEHWPEHSAESTERLKLQRICSNGRRLS
jgi:hypothetical protein